jgi:hypothetical protein
MSGIDKRDWDRLSSGRKRTFIFNRICCLAWTFFIAEAVIAGQNPGLVNNWVVAGCFAATVVATLISWVYAEK